MDRLPDRMARRFWELMVQGAPSFNLGPDRGGFVGSWDNLPEATRNLLSYSFARLEMELLQHVITMFKEAIPSFDPPSEEADAPPA